MIWNNNSVCIDASMSGSYDGINIHWERHGQHYYHNLESNTLVTRTVTQINSITHPYLLVVFGQNITAWFCIFGVRLTICVECILCLILTVKMSSSDNHHQLGSCWVLSARLYLRYFNKTNRSRHRRYLFLL